MRRQQWRLLHRREHVPALGWRQDGADGRDQYGRQEVQGPRHVHEGRRLGQAHGRDRHGREVDEDGRGDLQEAAVGGHSKRVSTYAAGSNGMRSSTPSPTPTNSTGMSNWRMIERITPPFAVPSSLVTTMPLTFTASRNAAA